MKRSVAGAILFWSICSLGAAPGIEHAWWLKVEFVPRDAAVESLPVQELDVSWAAASPLRETDLPPEAFAPGESVKEHGGAFEVVADLDGDERDEKAIVGVYQTKAGEFGEFVLVLGADNGAGWNKRALFTAPGRAGFSVLFLDGERLVWASCMECDSSCEVIPAQAEWDLKCSSCCDEE